MLQGVPGFQASPDAASRSPASTASLMPAMVASGA